MVSYDSKQKIWKGPQPTPMFHHDCSVGRLIYNSLRRFPKNICQICLGDGKATTNLEMLEWSVRLAKIFQQRGICHEDVIAIVAINSTYQTAAAVACLFNATPFHGVNPSLNAKILTHILAITKPKIIFCDANNYENVKQASSSWTNELIILTGEIDGVTHVEDLLTETKIEASYQPLSLFFGGDQTMAILCSSGTTGLPKAVCLSNYMLSIVLCNPFFTSESIIFSYSGLDWFTGVFYMLLSVGDSCRRIISDKPFSPEHFVNLVETHKINGAALTPMNVSALVSCPLARSERLASLRALAVGGGWIPTATLRKIQKILEGSFIFYSYGGTEFGGVSVSVSSEKFGNTVGKLAAGVQVRIVSDEGQNLERGQTGEIYVHNGTRWNGYYGNLVETQKLQDSSGWFHTGDLGYFDNEDNLYIVDRKKEICKCMGYHYWPKELEAVIAEIPGVQDVCVAGVYDECYGDAPAALVVRCPDSYLTEDEIKQHVSKVLDADFKQLHAGVLFVNALPHNNNGKILRESVKKLLTQAHLSRQSVC